MSEVISFEENIPHRVEELICINCKKCGKSAEIEIKISDYDTQKNKQFCNCGGKMKRVIEWQGWAKASGEGWYGKNGSNVI